MVRSDHAVSMRFRPDRKQQHQQSVPSDEPTLGEVDFEDPPATAREVVNGMVLGLSIGGLIAVALYAL